MQPHAAGGMDAYDQDEDDEAITTTTALKTLGAPPALSVHCTNRSRRQTVGNCGMLKRAREDDTRFGYGGVATSTGVPQAKRSAAGHTRPDLLDGAGQHAALASWAARVPNADAVSVLRNGVSSHAFAGRRRATSMSSPHWSPW